MSNRAAFKHLTGETKYPPVFQTWPDVCIQTQYRSEMVLHMICTCRLGLTIKCLAGGKEFTCRLPFIRPAQDRKDVKDIIVEMTNTAKAKA